jgi:hypothetical protein
MAVICPNIEDSPTFDAMAVRDSVDFYVLTTNVNGVVSGLQVTQDTGSDMKVQVAAGSCQVGTTTYTLGTAWTSPTITAASSGDRRDVVVYRAGSGPVYIVGTACALTGTIWTRTSNQNPPVKPNVVTTTDVVLAEVYVAYNTTAIVSGSPSSPSVPTSGNIVDKSNVLPTFSLDPTVRYVSMTYYQ